MSETCSPCAECEPVDRRGRMIRVLAKRYGRRVERSGTGHYKLVRDGCVPVTASASPKNVDHWLIRVEKDLKATTPDDNS